ncbi:alpha/beta hydrolase-fold protein, partial [Bacteroidia bacterium]|nr:alpha/beta hydrolase-fold protein [Bacteroidia bacterium]
DKRFSRLSDSLKLDSLEFNYRIIGIGQKHFNKSLRQRDFAPPADGSFFSKNASYTGNTENFYRFISTRVMPEYDAQSDYRVLLGHSYGGIFGVYVGTHIENHFDKIYAISPSLWINSSNFLSNYERDSSLHINTSLHILYGSLEELNKVAPEIERFQKILKPDDFKSVAIKKIKWAGHKSILIEIYTLEY